MATGTDGELKLYFKFQPALIYIGDSRMWCRPNEETCPKLYTSVAVTSLQSRLLLQ